MEKEALNILLPILVGCVGLLTKFFITLSKLDKKISLEIKELQIRVENLERRKDYETKKYENR